MIKKFKCRKCNGIGCITDDPVPYSYTPPATHRCDACEGTGYIEVDTDDEVQGKEGER